MLPTTTASTPSRWRRAGVGRRAIEMQRASPCGFSGGTRCRTRQLAASASATRWVSAATRPTRWPAATAMLPATCRKRDMDQTLFALSWRIREQQQRGRGRAACSSMVCTVCAVHRRHGTPPRACVANPRRAFAAAADQVSGEIRLCAICGRRGACGRWCAWAGARSADGPPSRPTRCCSRRYGRRRRKCGRRCPMRA